MTTHNKSDIHEALRRKYADTPQLPADFLQRVHLADEKQKKAEIRRRQIRISGVISAAAILVVAFILMKPKAEVAVRPSEHLVAHVQTQQQTRIDATPDTSIHKDNHVYTQVGKHIGMKPKKHWQKEEIRSADESQPVEKTLLVDEPLPADEKVINMHEVVKVIKISPEREAQLMAQLEEMKPEIYAYMDEVSAQAKEYQLQIDEMLDEANQQALELEYKLLELFHDELNLLYINGD